MLKSTGAWCSGTLCPPGSKATTRTQRAHKGPSGSSDWLSRWTSLLLQSCRTSNELQSQGPSAKPAMGCSCADQESSLHSCSVCHRPALIRADGTMWVWHCPWAASWHKAFSSKRQQCQKQVQKGLLMNPQCCSSWLHSGWQTAKHYWPKWTDPPKC